MNAAKRELYDDPPSSCEAVGDDGPVSGVIKPCLHAPDGSSAELDGERLRIRDRRGAILFEYDAETGKGALTIPEGDLRLAAPRGSIELFAGEGLRCVSAGEVAFHSASSVSMTASDGTRSAGVSVDPGATAITGERLAVSAEEAELRLTRARYLGKWLEAGVERAEVTLEKMERRVGTLIARATNAYHYVEELHQLKTKRLRHRAVEGMHLDAGHVVMKAREDVDIDGERINLG
ncbi:MAG: DUF3540 domain-containing protein [Myxococcales bacterium]|nr:DUF3540 domain-containing protein [Myxococcales bacterium]